MSRTRHACVLFLGILLASHVPAAELQPAPPRKQAGEVNLALRGKASQTGQYNDASAALAIDGKTDGNLWHGSVASTDNRPYAWWQVDLGAMHDIGRIRLWNRTDSAPERLQGFHLLVAENPIQAGDPAAAAQEPGVWSAHCTKETGPCAEFPVGARGRYVRIQFDHMDYLSLAEVEVLQGPATAPRQGAAEANAAKPAVKKGDPQKGSRNLALNAKAEQSSTGYGGEARRAVDGNHDGNYYNNSVTHTESDSDAWWQVDLGEVKPIGRVRIWNRTDMQVRRLGGFHLIVSEKPLPRAPLAQSLATPGVWSLPFPGVVGEFAELPVGARGRHVRIQFDHTDYLTLAEVEVFEATGPLPEKKQGAEDSAAEEDTSADGALPGAGTVLATPAWALNRESGLDLGALAVSRDDALAPTLRAGLETLGAAPREGADFPPEQAQAGANKVRHLAKAMSLRETQGLALRRVNDAWDEAVAAAQAGDEKSTQEALAICRAHLETAQAADNGLREVARQMAEAAPLEDPIAAWGRLKREYSATVLTSLQVQPGTEAESAGGGSYVSNGQGGPFGDETIVRNPQTVSLAGQEQRRVRIPSEGLDNTRTTVTEGEFRGTIIRVRDHRIIDPKTNKPTAFVLVYNPLKKVYTRSPATPDPNDPDWCIDDETPIVGKSPATVSPPASTQGAGRSPFANGVLPEDKARAVETHRNNIRIIEAHLAADERELALARDDKTRAALEWRILNGRSDLVAEQDLISSIESGTLRHSRSPFDDYAKSRFQETLKDEQTNSTRFLRLQAGIPRLISLLPKDQQAAMRAFVDRQMTAEVRGRMDSERLQQVAEALHKQVDGYWSGQQARHTEDAIRYDDYLARAERVKTISDMGVMVGTMGGASSAQFALRYGVTTAVSTGNPEEAVSQILQTYSAPLSAAYEAMKAYPEGGAWGAAKAAATNYVLARLNQAGAKPAVATKGAAVGATRAAAGGQAVKVQAAGLVPRDASELAAYNAARARGKALADSFAETQARIVEARNAGRPIAELRSLERELQRKTAAVQNDYHAKSVLKYSAPKATQQAFIRQIDEIHNLTEQRFHALMSERGWSPQRIRPIRNASSAGTVNMDFDIMLVETPGQQFLKNGSRETIHDYHREASSAWRRALDETAGIRAHDAFEEFTFSGTGEAFKDTAWLRANKSQVKSQWATQAGDVTRYKAQTMVGSDKISLDRLTRLQEAARGAGKDIRTKLIDRLNHGHIKGPGGRDRLDDLRSRWGKIGDLLNAIGEGRIDPIHGERQLMRMTGGYGIEDVIDHAATLQGEFTKRWASSR
jgi:hypothetical protein